MGLEETLAIIESALVKDKEGNIIRIDYSVIREAGWMGPEVTILSEPFYDDEAIEFAIRIFKNMIASLGPRSLPDSWKAPGGPHVRSIKLGRGTTKMTSDSLF